MRGKKPRQNCSTLFFLTNSNCFIYISRTNLKNKHKGRKDVSKNDKHIHKLYFYIKILFFRLRLNILIFLPFLGCKYSCEYSLIILGIQSGPCQHNVILSHCPIMTLMGCGSNFGTSHQAISNGNRTEWSPIRSVIIRAITKSDRDRAAGVRFVYHENDYRPDDTKCYYQFILKVTISDKRRAKL